MGLIQSAFVATSSALGDSWKEFFYCDALPADVLVVKGMKKQVHFLQTKETTTLSQTAVKLL